MVGERPRTRVVDAADQEAVAVDRRGEVLEAPAVGLLGPPHVEVVGRDVGDHGGVRAVDQEGAVTLVGLRHEEVAGTELRVVAGGGEHPTDGVRRVGAGSDQGRGEQRGRGRLAVGAGHRDDAGPGHHRPQAGGARQDPQAPAPALDHLGVVVARGSRDDERVGVADMVGGVAQVAGHAELAQPGQERRVVVVAAGDGQAARGHDARDGRERRAADADEVHPAELLGRQQHVGNGNPHRPTP